MTTDKAFCREIAALLAAHGVADAVLCPGSRNAPLIVAINREPRIRAVTVIDERSAAFIALGIARELGRPVALVCTSGSAVLNFAPAVAEAYYRQVPLIVISADRPAEWIDQDDSQTIRQIGILANIAKYSCNVPVERGEGINSPLGWYANRTINDALLEASARPAGPVHINVQLDVPLGGMVDCPPCEPRAINTVKPQNELSSSQLSSLIDELSGKRVLIVVGFMPPNPRLSEALCRLASLPNFAVMHEAQANIRIGAIPKIDSALSTLTEEEKADLLPDLVITLGGSLVSRFVKKWLRSGSYLQGGSLRHWHVGCQPHSVDCFMCLEKRIEMDAAAFVSQLAESVASSKSDYSRRWSEVVAKADALDAAYAEHAPWSDYKAMSMLMPRIPGNWHLQLSNGTAVRYAQLFDYGHIARIDCNRGVSGIDGCTSTAIGTASVSEGVTLLVTGDMSCQYDIGALAATCISPRFKMAVLNNGGGGIFRFIDATSRLDELDERFCCQINLPLRQLAEAYGFAYFSAASIDEFEQAWPLFAAERERPVILNIITPPQQSAEVLKSYFTRNYPSNLNL